MVNQVNISSIIYYYFFVFGGVVTTLGLLFRHYLIKTIKEENEKLLAALAEQDKRTSRIEYALYNDGKTGLVQEFARQGAKMDALIENQQFIKTDVEVMKAKYDS